MILRWYPRNKHYILPHYYYQSILSHNSVSLTNDTSNLLSTTRQKLIYDLT